MTNHDPTATSSPATPGSADRQLDFHPGMGMRWEITRSTADTGGELFEATNWIDPHMPGPPVHVHPTAEESYQVIEGALEVFMNGEWSPVRAGEKATVPAGVPHSVRNAERRARANREHPSARAEVRVVLSRHAQADPRGQDQAPAAEGAPLRHLRGDAVRSYPDEIRTTKPPNGVFKALASVGRALRFKL